MTPFYQDEAVTIYHGDCRDVLASNAFTWPDAVVSDPPYGVLSDGGSAATRRSGGNQDAGVMSWDIAPDRDLIARLTERPAMLWGGCHLQLPPTFGYLVWDKQIDGLNCGEVEYCWTNLRFAPRVFRYRAVGVDGGKQHPTQKPEALMRWCFGFLPKTAETISSRGAVAPVSLTAGDGRMTPQESGRKGGLVNGQQRSTVVRQRARQRAVAVLAAIPDGHRGPLVDLLTAGHLDAWLVLIERASYRRGYCVRDETLRRETAAAERANLIADARAQFRDGEAA